MRIRIIDKDAVELHAAGIKDCIAKGGVGHSLVTPRMIVRLVMVVTLSTLKNSTSPATMDLVHPVSVLSRDVRAEESVGFADAQIESPTVGGKLA